MTIFVENLFQIPLIVIEIKDWEEKKKKFLSCIPDNLLLKEREYIKTNYGLDPDSDLMNVSNIFKEEIVEIEKIVENKLEVTGSWIEVAEKGMYHEIHNHGQTGLSAVCYLNFDKDKHQPLIFMSPFNNFFNGDTNKSIPGNMKEGVLLIFPSFLLHYTLPNQSDELRVALSFNLKSYGTL